MTEVRIALFGFFSLQLTARIRDKSGHGFDGIRAERANLIILHILYPCAASAALPAEFESIEFVCGVDWHCSSQPLFHGRYVRIFLDLVDFCKDKMQCFLGAVAQSG